MVVSGFNSTKKFHLCVFPWLNSPFCLHESLFDKTAGERKPSQVQIENFLIAVVSLHMVTRFYAVKCICIECKKQIDGSITYLENNLDHRQLSFL